MLFNVNAFHRAIDTVKNNNGKYDKLMFAGAY